MSLLRSRIDNAFYRALSSDSSPQQSGGFLPPSPLAAEREDEQSSYIPISRIPYALQLLDLPPDDDQVLAVFRSAASGWEDDPFFSSSADKSEGRVSLKDWRAVCDALMDDGGDDDDDDNERSGTDDGDEKSLEDLSSELEETSGGSSDEYRITDARSSRKRSRKPAATAGGAGTTRKTRARKTQSEASSRRRQSPHSLNARVEMTPRQQLECLRAFMLFFPGLPEEVVKHRRLGVREVNAAAAVLNEKIKSGEIIGMLEAFSTSPDKTMSLSDFEKMMIATQLA
ncbi:hypothetical protein F5148DRAFT_1146687 [Russula earlei]|uniref:Uncharacterized protein n=1 Tax=Russula earlei TaxID=71964 RepID=A0ACC0UJ53_9AGAM|nr:hypothetical protein F5148DRAFT_1146687 [Russula earlei]